MPDLLLHFRLISQLLLFFQPISLKCDLPFFTYFIVIVKNRIFIKRFVYYSIFFSSILFFYIYIYLFSFKFTYTFGLRIRMRMSLRTRTYTYSYTYKSEL